MKLNLGCGSDILKGWHNIDLVDIEGIDLICDISKELPFHDNTIERISASDVLEHIMYAEVPKVLEELYRVLIRKGTVTIKVPSLSTIAMRYVKHDIGCKEFVRLVYGGQEDGNIANAHKSGFDPQYLSLLMNRAGFKITKIINHPEMPDQNNLVMVGVKR